MRASPNICKGAHAFYETELSDIDDTDSVRRAELFEWATIISFGKQRPHINKTNDINATSLSDKVPVRTMITFNELRLWSSLETKPA